MQCSKIQYNILININIKFILFNRIDLNQLLFVIG